VYVLVDYDNIPIRNRTRGVEPVVDRALNLLELQPFDRGQRIYIRLYGGWYEKDRFTKAAQELAIGIENRYPSPFSVEGKVVEKPFTVRVHVELAYSLIIRPEKHLFSTYRPRKMFNINIKCLEPTSLDCSSEECPMQTVYQAFQEKRCPNPDCHKELSQFFIRGGQKLVDSMLISDLIYLSYAGEPRIALVSSDDDFVPGIVTALLLDREVIHIHTRSEIVRTDFYGLEKFSNYRVKRLILK